MKRAILLLVGLLLIPVAAAAGANDVAQGRAIFLEYCVSCHGLSGDGDGPVALLLATPPANLRKLSERYGNPLPEDQIARFIDGRADVNAHGPRDMPVWVSDSMEASARSKIKLPNWSPTFSQSRPGYAAHRETNW